MIERAVLKHQHNDVIDASPSDVQVFVAELLVLTPPVPLGSRETATQYALDRHPWL